MPMGPPASTATVSSYDTASRPGALGEEATYTKRRSSVSPSSIQTVHLAVEGLECTDRTGLSSVPGDPQTVGRRSQRPGRPAGSASPVPLRRAGWPGRAAPRHAARPARPAAAGRSRGAPWLAGRSPAGHQGGHVLGDAHKVQRRERVQRRPEAAVGLRHQYVLYAPSQVAADQAPDVEVVDVVTHARVVAAQELDERQALRRQERLVEAISAEAEMALRPPGPVERQDARLRLTDEAGRRAAPTSRYT